MVYLSKNDAKFWKVYGPWVVLNWICGIHKTQQQPEQQGMNYSWGFWKCFVTQSHQIDRTTTTTLFLKPPAAHRGILVFNLACTRILPLWHYHKQILEERPNYMNWLRHLSPCWSRLNWSPTRHWKQRKIRIKSSFHFCQQRFQMEPGKLVQVDSQPPEPH